MTSSTIIANLKGAQGAQGVQGAQGLPGVNAVANDTATAGYITTTGASATKSALISRNFAANVKDYGAIGDGIADDSAAFIAAFAASPSIFAPYTSAGYVLAAAITIPAGGTITGAGKYATKLLKGFNGDMFLMSDGATVRDLTINGRGATFTGRGFVFAGSDGHQSITDVNIYGTNGPCFDFAISAGSQCRVTSCDINRYNGVTGSGLYAVVIPNAVMVSAVPRSFSQCEFQGGPAFSFGGCNDFYVVACSVGDLQFSANTRGLNMVACRLMNQLALTVDGHGNSIVGCDIAAQVTIASGADAITIGPGAFNNLPVIDNSGNSRNDFYHWSIAYTPVLGSGGTAPVLGNGSVVGTYARSGTSIDYTIEFNVGSTTTLGTGGLTFTLPQARTSATIQSAGIATLLIGSVNYTAAARISGAASTVEMIRDTSGAVASNSPAAFATGSVIRIAGSYTL